MSFLKRIEIIGFKSFSNKTIINFEHSLTGVVGPNGSGKSNIIDAIKWVFGLQSSKFLRSNISNDIIFNGTETQEPLNFAEVKLIFDNSKNNFSLNFAEVQISRRIFRNNSESEYYINNVKSKLKEIKLLAKESGLSKSSLSIISQGNVSDFAQAKPLERRILLEDAAGISKYKQTKHESLKKLDGANNNLERLKDIINEIKRNLPYLKKEYDKAIIYKKLKERLEKIEISILISDINFFNIEKEKLFNLKTSFIKKKEFLANKKNSLQKGLDAKEFNFEEITNKLSKLNKEYNLLISNISNLKIKKIKLEKQYINNDENIKNRVLFEYNEAKNNLKIEEKRFFNLEEKSKNFHNELNLTTKKIDELEINAQILKDKINNKNAKIWEINNNINFMKSLFLGPKTVLENRKYLPGILGMVKDIINISEKYEIAFSTILGNNLQNIIVDSKRNAKIAIDFLKENKSGNATFIPLDVNVPKPISENELFILKSIKGFVGIASNLVKYEDKYNSVISYLLSKHIICNDLNSALEIGKLINYHYMITTLGGSQIKVFGVLSGGHRKIKNQLSEKRYNSELETNKKELEILNQEILANNEKITKLKSIKNDIEIKISQNDFLLLNIKNTKKQYEEKLNKLKNDYKFLNLTFDNKENDDSINLKILDQLKNYVLQKDDIEQNLTILENDKAKLYLSITEMKHNLKNTEIEFESVFENLNKTEQDLLKAELALDTNLKTLLNSYGMTYEFAKAKYNQKIANENEIRNEIKELKYKLKNIGNVNLDVIFEYQRENERYQHFILEYDNLKQAISKISSTISKLDAIITEKFDKTIKNINISLISTFKRLFNGGKARLFYTNPDDILNTGIDIEVNPPGKKILNIHLLSGGEKSLVALSVLFAILESNPLPLVILDEVEAPLDFANLKGFAQYLSQIATKVQFIIVTHRITTMQSCDVLYGVTMQEKGISKVLKVTLLNAKHLTDEYSSDKKETSKLEMESIKA